jgi:hypothetical protein
MSEEIMAHPWVLGLFQKRLDGDDALWRLMQRRFCQANLGVEVYAASPGELRSTLEWQPTGDLPRVVHLSRDYDFWRSQTRDEIASWAAKFAGRVYGLVIHDRPDIGDRPDEWERCLIELEERLSSIPSSPYLFVEYAAGIEPEQFIAAFARIHKLRHISACVDVGHLGVFQARRFFAKRHSGRDICQLKGIAGLDQLTLAAVSEAVGSALPVALEVITALSILGKPLHYHLHDGHPLSRLSPYSVSDHLSFFQQLSIDATGQTATSVPLMYGPEGLAQIVGAALRHLPRALVSFTFEVHETGDRLALGDAADLFTHWSDKTNAERMNHWLAMLVQNQRAARAAIQAAPRTLNSSWRSAGDNFVDASEPLEQ